MSWSRRAGWNKASGSYSYIPEEYRHREMRGRWFFFIVRMLAVIVVFLLVSGHFSNTKTISSQVTAAVHVSAPITQPSQSAKPVTPPPQDLSPQLRALFSSWAAQNKTASWGISLQQISGGMAAAAYQPDQPFYPASIYKLLILETLFKKLPYDSWSRPMSAGISYAACIDKMIRYSDNTCGIALGKFAGWTAANNQLKTLGLTGTALNTADSQLHTTAADVSRYLQYFYADTAYPQSTQFALNVMAHQVFRAGIPAGSPDCTVYDKIGDLNGYKHDAAVVVCPKTTYVLVVMSKGGSYTQIADIARQVNSLLASP